MTERITLRQWNRTLLARQHLLSRVDEDAIEVLDRCVGMQAQDPRAPFYGLWSRMADFEPSELDDLLSSREVVRMALLRSTVFLADAEDARWIRAVAQPVLDAELSVHARRLESVSVDEVLTTATELLAEGPASTAALGRHLTEVHPGADRASMVGVARCGLPLVQVPPRGLWRGSAAPTYRLFDDWVGPRSPAVTGDEARKDLIRLYLRGFGPATVNGIQSWCGLTRLRPLIDEMVADWELTTLTGPDDEALFDLEGLDIVDDDLAAPPRLIAPYDNILVAQADRRRVADEEYYRALQTANGISPGFVLVDGRLAGSWGFDAQRRVRVNLDVEPDRRTRSALHAEIELLQDFCDR
ncbi:winged helix DNA-binding domain-containing protein [Gordonia sp. NPDC003424]